MAIGEKKNQHQPARGRLGPARTAASAFVHARRRFFYLGNGLVSIRTQIINRCVLLLGKVSEEAPAVALWFILDSDFGAIRETKVSEVSGAS